jgi:hypothetical protein
MCGLDCHDRHAAPKTMRLLYDDAKHDLIPYTNRSAQLYRDMEPYRNIQYDCDMRHAIFRTLLFGHKPV